MFFGLVAVAGTVLVQLGRTTTPATWAAAVAIGTLACAILVANNLRDLRGDAAVGKRTLATRFGDRGTRWFFAALMLVSGGRAVVALPDDRWALLGLVLVPFLADRSARCWPEPVDGR